MSVGTSVPLWEEMVEPIRARSDNTLHSDAEFDAAPHLMAFTGMRPFHKFSLAAEVIIAHHLIPLSNSGES